LDVTLMWTPVAEVIVAHVRVATTTVRGDHMTSIINDQTCADEGVPGVPTPGSV